MLMLDTIILFIFKNIIMNTYHDAFDLAKCNDSSWVAQIIVKKNNGSYVDIVTLLSIQKVFSSFYSKDTCFLSVNLLDVDDYQKLIIYLIGAAKKCEPSLVAGSVQNLNTKYCLMVIQLQCVNYRLSRFRSKRAFCNTFMQLPCTQIKQSNGTNSVEGKSCSSPTKKCLVQEN